jgi:hypothetical protein
MYKSAGGNHTPPQADSIRNAGEDFIRFFFPVCAALPLIRQPAADTFPESRKALHFSRLSALT